MLDYLIPIEWKKTDQGFAGYPQELLPDNFSLVSPDYPDSNNIVTEHLVGSLMRMSVPWVWTGNKIIVHAAPIQYDWKTQRFLISAADIESVDFRMKLAKDGRLSPIVENDVGCGGQLVEALATERFIQSAGFDPKSLLSEPNGQVWLRKQNMHDVYGLPNALAFHQDAFPEEFSLTIEPTTACNFRCGFCYGRHLKQGILRRAQFDALLDNSPTLKAVEFVGEGEPLMNKDTPGMIAACKSRGMWVHVTSNGSRMTEERATMLVDLNIDSFAVSIEATDPENFRRMRPGGELSDLIDAVRIIRSEIKRRGVGPKIRLWVSLMRSNLHRIDDFFAFADEHNFDQVEFQTLNTLPAYRRFYPQSLDGEESDWAAIDNTMKLPGISSRAKKALAQLRKEFSGTTCKRFSHSLAPSFEGQISPCVLLKTPDYPSLGDLTNTPLHEIWQEPRFRRFRFALAHGIVLQSCHGCTNIAGA